jgi:hypothetical protein
MELLESHADSLMKFQEAEDVWTLSQFQRKEHVDVRLA